MRDRCLASQQLMLNRLSVAGIIYRGGSKKRLLTVKARRQVVQRDKLNNVGVFAGCFFAGSRIRLLLNLSEVLECS